MRTLFTAAIHGLSLHQLDVNNTLLHGNVKEYVSMTIQEGFRSDKPNQVHKLMKSLYGLKQANR